MKMRKMLAYLIALSMLLCQSAVFMTTASAEAGEAPLIYYNFGDTTEWSADDIQPWTDADHYKKALTYNPEKRVRVGDNASGRVSFEDYGNYGQVLKMNNSGGPTWRELSFYIDDGSGTLFNTNRNLYIKTAYWITGSDAGSSSTSVQTGWRQPWSSTKVKAYDDNLGSQDGWHVYSGALVKSSHGEMTSMGPLLEFTGKVTGSYRIKYIALFSSQEAADAWDPSVTAVTSNGVSAVIDNYAHKAQFAESVRGNPTLTLADGASAVQTLDFDGRSYGLGRRVKYNVTDIAGNVTEWQIDYGEVADDTSILEERAYGNDKKYYIYDFSTEQNMGIVTASQVAYTGNDSYSKVQYDSLDTKPIASLSDSYGPAMEVSSDGATQYPYVMLNDPIDTDYRYVKLAYGVYKLNLASAPSVNKEYYGTLGFGDLNQAAYLTAVNEAGNIAASVSNSAGEAVETGMWTSSVVTVPQSSDAESALDITTVNAGDANVSADSRIAYKYIAMFDNLADAEAYDPSVVSAEYDGEAMEVDNIAHTMELELDTGVTEGSLNSIENKISIATIDDDVVEIYANDEPTVNETSESVTVTQEFEVVGIDGKSVIWTAVVTAPIVAPSEDYLFFDFTNIPSGASLRLHGTESGWDTRPYGYEVGKTSSDAAAELAGVNNNYGGPGLFIRASYSGTNRYTQFLLYSDEFDMTKTKYVRIEYSPESTRTDLGNDGTGRIIARWEATDGNGNVVSYPEGSHPTAKNIHTAVVQVDPVNSNNKVMRIGFYNFIPVVNIKNVGVFATRAEAEAFDPSVRSVRIADNRNEVTGKTAKINGVTHTATVEIADNTAPADMPVIAAADISSLVLDNVGATTQHDYVHQAASAAIVAGSQKIAQDLTSVMSSVDYNVTDKTGTVHTWKFILKSKKNRMTTTNDASKQYHIIDFTDAETVQGAILDGTVAKRDNDLTNMYPANVSKKSSSLHAVNKSGKVGLNFDFPNDELRFNWYQKALLNYDSGAAAGSNVQIHWTINWGTTGTGSSGDRTIYTNGLGAGEWTTVSTNLTKAAVSQPLGLYSNTGSDMNFKYIALFGNAADRDAFDPSVVNATITKNNTAYVAQIDNIAHTITFPDGCGSAADLDAAVIELYNNGEGISAVSNGSASVESDTLNDTYAIVKSYTVTGLDGNEVEWTAKIPFEPISIVCGENSAEIQFSQLINMQKMAAVYSGDVMIEAFVAQNNTISISFNDYTAGEYVIKAFGWESFATLKPLVKAKEEMYYKE